MSLFSDRLNQALEMRQMSAADLSRKTGISEATISNYRKGAYDPKGARMTFIADALSVNVEWLMGLVDNPFVYTFPTTLKNTPGNRLYTAMNALNDAGWDKVIAYATDLADNPKYQRK